MLEGLKVVVPLFAIMLLPVWIPLLTVSIGAIADRRAARRAARAGVTVVNAEAMRHPGTRSEVVAVPVVATAAAPAREAARSLAA